MSFCAQFLAGAVLRDFRVKCTQVLASETCSFLSTPLEKILNIFLVYLSLLQFLVQITTTKDFN